MAAKSQDSGPPKGSPTEHGKTPVLDTLYQDLLEAHARLEEKLYRRTMALATVAHQLKTPLAIIPGYVELLLGEKPGSLTDRQKEILEDLRKNCARLDRFIRDFLVYSALEAGKITLTYEMGNLNDCLAQTYDYWADRFRQKGVAFYFLRNPQLPFFEFDSDKVQHLVSNLLENALKYAPPGGTVWLTAEPHVWERLTVDDRPQSRQASAVSPAGVNSVRVAVADTGPGVPPEYHQEVFDDFFKVPNQGDSTEGTGLGLAICKRLVHAHGGKIWLEDEPSGGSKVSFLLPLKPPKGEAQGTHEERKS